MISGLSDLNRYLLSHDFFWGYSCFWSTCLIIVIVYLTAYSLYTFEYNSINKFTGFKRLTIFCVVVGLVDYGAIIRFPIKSGSSVQ